jgi:hypothetical protein
MRDSQYRGKSRGCSAGAITLSPPLKHHSQSRLGEMAMADHAELEYGSATGNDMLAHEQTYHNFITLVKTSLAVIVVILILMAFFLA